jgi:hypothetical protein
MVFPYLDRHHSAFIRRVMQAQTHMLQRTQMQPKSPPPPLSPRSKRAVHTWVDAQYHGFHLPSVAPRNTSDP